VYHLEHLHQALRAIGDLVEYFLLHLDVVLSVVAVESTVETDALLAIDADDLDLPLVLRAELSFRH